MLSMKYGIVLALAVEALLLLNSRGCLVAQRPAATAAPFPSFVATEEVLSHQIQR